MLPAQHAHATTASLPQSTPTGDRLLDRTDPSTTAANADPLSLVDFDEAAALERLQADSSVNGQDPLATARVKMLNPDKAIAQTTMTLQLASAPRHQEAFAKLVQRELQRHVLDGIASVSNSQGFTAQLCSPVKIAVLVVDRNRDSRSEQSPVDSRALEEPGAAYSWSAGHPDETRTILDTSDALEGVAVLQLTTFVRLAFPSDSRDGGGCLRLAFSLQPRMDAGRLNLVMHSVQLQPSTCSECPKAEPEVDWSLQPYSNALHALATAARAENISRLANTLLQNWLGHDALPHAVSLALAGVGPIAAPHGQLPPSWNAWIEPGPPRLVLEWRESRPDLPLLGDGTELFIQHFAQLSVIDVQVPCVRIAELVQSFLRKEVKEVFADATGRVQMSQVRVGCADQFNVDDPRISLTLEATLAMARRADAQSPWVNVNVDIRAFINIPGSLQTVVSHLTFLRPVPSGTNAPRGPGAQDGDWTAQATEAAKLFREDIRTRLQLALREFATLDRVLAHVRQQLAFPPQYRLEVHNVYTHRIDQSTVGATLTITHPFSALERTLAQFLAP
ncbi:hypothetical protein CAOG_008177 [Capsaspora owczarzaki ATCC 30864]|uniref:Uncharacterized protein n=2 Tax=Capsaspora owczarzaki (strain ATCC 30864) TaxID=595528 RepID=A0A0D2X5P5_CAPO3|nr:hypothetical protein CAOG_008177 [Capsaspora owczarzaki ATCC 30864]